MKAIISRSDTLFGPLFPKPQYMWNPAGQKSCGSTTTMRGEEFALPTVANGIRAANTKLDSVYSQSVPLR